MTIVKKTLEIETVQCDFCDTIPTITPISIELFQKCKSCGKDVCNKHERWTYYPGGLYQMFCYCPDCYKDLSESKGVEKRDYSHLDDKKEKEIG